VPFAVGALTLVMVGTELTVMLAVSVAVLKTLDVPLVAKSAVTLAVLPLVPTI
jgi:hypothetical protein